MLHAAAQSDWVRQYEATGAWVIAVTDLNDYPAMAAGLSNALFKRDDRVAH
jgi:hypothetical protein